MTKRNIAIGLVIFWAILILFRIFFSDEKEIKSTTTQEIRTNILVEKGGEAKDIKYPEITGYRFKKDIFADLIKDISVKNTVEKEKKDRNQACSSSSNIA